LAAQPQSELNFPPPLEPISLSTGTSTSTPGQNFVCHTHTFTNTKKISSELALWHERLGHLNFEAVSKILNIPAPQKPIFCASCCQGKSTLLPASKEKASRATRVGELLHSDMTGPIEVSTPSGKRYILIFVDDYSRRIFIRLLKTKDEFAKEFQALDNLIEVETTKRVAFLRSDSDGPYTSGELEDYCRKRGIQRQYSTPYNQFQNGVSERSIRVLVEMMRTLLIHAGAPKSLWGEAACYAAQIMNRKPTKAVTLFPNPMSAWRGLQLNKVHESLRVWGCRALTYDHRQEVKKLDPKTIEGILVGMDTERKAWRIYIKGQVVCRRDVTFVENEFPFKTRAEHSQLKIGDEYPNDRARNITHDGDLFQRDPLSNNIPEKQPDPSSSVESETPIMSDSARKSSRPWKPTNSILESYVNMVNSEDTIPKTYKQAMESPDKELWQAAIDSEILSHLKNETLLPCELPEARKPVPLGWVFKIKINPDGTKRYKARIIMKGFLQREGIDFMDTYAPVAKWSSIRIFLALATIFDWDLTHIDFETAFMIPKMDTVVYVKTVEGMEQLTPGGHIAQMLKGVNGCKQGSKLFYDEAKGTIIAMGFTMSLYDSCVFTLFTEDEKCIIILWVDDLLVASKGKTLLKRLLDEMKSKYKFKVITEPTLFLGAKLKRDRERGTMEISQEGYFSELLKKFNMDNCNAIQTPMEPGKQYIKSGELAEEEKKYMKDKPYRSLACSLMYPSNITRPDLSYACNTASRHLQNPGKEHWQLLKRITRYVKGTLALGLSYKAGTTDITGFPDASWADNLDDRKSTGAYLFFIGSCLVSWSSKKQGYIALSTNNAELGALADASREAYYIRGLVNELHPGFLPSNKPITIYEDNEGTIAQANNNIMNNATRTIALKFHFVREEIKSKRIQLKPVASQDQIGDLLTKALPAPSFIKLRDQALGVSAWNIQPTVRSL
jgi:hypothetical protein